MNTTTRPALGSPLEQAVREVLADCPQAPPQADYYDAPDEYAAAVVLFRVRQKLEPALLMTAGAVA